MLLFIYNIGIICGPSGVFSKFDLTSSGRRVQICEGLDHFLRLAAYFTSLLGYYLFITLVFARPLVNEYQCYPKVAFNIKKRRDFF